MAKCDEGYLCEVCGQPVQGLTTSALYLQYVIGWVDPETLHTRRECHIRCQPSLAQFIDDERFSAVLMDGDFDRRQLDQRFATDRAELVSRGYRRLHELQKKRTSPTVQEYPLPEVIARWR